MSKIFDIAEYGCTSVSDFVKQYHKRKNVRCQNHEDSHPSAQVNETNVYCHVCSESFFYQGFNSQYVLNTQRAKDCHKRLNDAKNQSVVRQFLRERGIKNTVIPIFELGFDESKNALVFPIKNIRGQINGFGYRQIEEKEPKYWNDKGSETFIKSNNLYGIHAITDKCRHLVICEGYIDVIRAFQHDFQSQTCFVGLMGTAFTEHHIPLLKNLKKTRNIETISLMLDKDATGKNATLKNIEILLEGDIYPHIIFDFEEENDFKDYKDVDEILRHPQGINYLKNVLKNNTHDWLDYLLKTQELSLDFPDNKSTTLEELKRFINLIKDPVIKGKYASKLCSLGDLYEDVGLKDRTYENILSLDSESVKEHFLKEESYFNCKLPFYFKFDEVLKWAKDNAAQFNIEEFKELEDPNYKILGNKDGEFAWRMYQIINPILYVKLVNVVSDNWDDLKRFFEKNTFDSIRCGSLSVTNENPDGFSNDTARQILNWWDKIEQDSIKLALSYQHIICTDIVDCYGAIYTHAIPQTLHGKEVAKKDTSDKLYGNKIDRLLTYMNWRQTNGIPQGSVLMDFVAEIVLHDIDRQLNEKCKLEKLSDYYVLRYRDDYRIFSNEIETAKRVLKLLGEVLSETGGMRLSSEKTKVENSIVIGAIKKDKLHYFECFKEGDSTRQNVLNIYLFSKKYPNSGSIFRLLKAFSKKINTEIDQISLRILGGKNEDILKGFDSEYFISILSEIMCQHPRTYPRVCSIIFNITAILPNERRKEVWSKLRRKMTSVPNNELMRIWLERTVYIHPKDTAGWHDFFAYFSEDGNKTLLIKAFNQENIWQFPSKQNRNIPDTSLILDRSIKEKLGRAKNRQEQKIDVNVPFELDEMDPFEY